jgi:hypothetical protein
VSINDGFSSCHRLDRADEGVAVNLFQQIPIGSGKRGRQQRFIILIRGQEDDVRVGTGDSNLTADLDTRAIGQAKIHQDDIGR